MRVRTRLIRTAAFVAALGAMPLAVAHASPPSLAFQNGIELTAPFPYGLAQGEPTIKVDNAGNMYVAAPGSTPIGCEVWTLPPGARSFAWRGAPDDGAGGGDCDLAFSPTVPAGQTVQTAYYSSLTLPEITVGSTADGGATWSTPNPLGSPVVGDDRQWMNAAPDGTVFMTAHLLASDNIGVFASTDGGLTYGFRGLAIDAAHLAQAAYNNELGTVIVDPYSSANPKPLYTVFTAPSSALANVNSAVGEVQSSNNAVYLASSFDGGYTWTDSQIWVGPSSDTYDHIFPAIAMDSSETLWVAWASQSHIYVTHAPASSSLTSGTDSLLDSSLDLLGSDSGTTVLSDVNQAGLPAGSLTWTMPVQVDQTGANANLYPWLAGGGRGRADLVWYAGTGVDNNDSSNKWVVRIAQFHDTRSGLGMTQAVASDHVIHYGQICTTGVTCGVTGNRNLLDFFTVALTPDGRAAIAWADDSATTGAMIYVTEQCSGVNQWTGKQLAATC